MLLCVCVRGCVYKRFRNEELAESEREYMQLYKVIETFGWFWPAAGVHTLRERRLIWDINTDAYGWLALFLGLLPCRKINLLPNCCRLVLCSSFSSRSIFLHSFYPLCSQALHVLLQRSRLRIKINFIGQVCWYIQGFCVLLSAALYILHSRVYICVSAVSHLSHKTLQLPQRGCRP